MRIYLALIHCFFLALPVAAAEKSHYDFRAARRALFELRKPAMPTQIEVSPPAPVGSPQEKLIAHYMTKLRPKYVEMAAMGETYVALRELISGGYYDSKRQLVHWQKEMDAIDKRYAEFQTDKEFEKAKLEYGRLAEGLTGQLAESARQIAMRIKFNQFPPEAKKLLIQVEQIHRELNQITDQSPKRADYFRTMPEHRKIILAYHAKELSFDEAWKKVEELTIQGSQAYGRDIVEKGRDKFNEAARLMTLIAKTKGYQNHADFAIAGQSEAHRAEFQSKEKLLAFLYGLLDATDEVTQKYYQSSARTLGFEDYKKLRPSQLGLLGKPTFMLMREYFPRERHVSTWFQAVRESGFSDEVLGQIIVDDQPRRNKNSHAHMAPLRTPSPKVMTIDGQTLNSSTSLESDNWDKASIYILQNLADDGIPELTTAFHEGGHALDYIHHRNDIGMATAYGLVETHSMAFEKLLSDREFLLAYGQKRDGTRPTEQIVDTFLKRLAVSDLLGFRQNVANAIFDIEVWNYDYVTGTEDYVTRAFRLSRELEERVHQAELPEDLKNELGAHHFITSHFWSGSVRYFGYVLAEVSSTMVMDKVREELAKRTGRASLYNQPEMAKLLIPLYMSGAAKPFPTPIEEFAGKEFSPKNFAQGLVAKVEQYVAELNDCSALLLKTNP